MVLEGYHDLMKEIFARSKHKMVVKGLFQLDENKMVVKWKALLHMAKTPRMSADPFFRRWGLNDIKNILRKMTSMVLEGYHDLMKEIFARSKHKTVAKGLFQLDENEMVVKCKALLHMAMTPGMSADPFFLFILSNIFGEANRHARPRAQCPCR